MSQALNRRHLAIAIFVLAVVIDLLGEFEIIELPGFRWIMAALLIIALLVLRAPRRNNGG
jgi:hypothetical protein